MNATAFIRIRDWLGMWQISGRSKITDFDEVVKLDSQYIDSWTIEKDVKIILKTILVVVKRNGSY